MNQANNIGEGKSAQKIPTLDQQQKQNRIFQIDKKIKQEYGETM